MFLFFFFVFFLIYSGSDKFHLTYCTIEKNDKTNLNTMFFSKNEVNVFQFQAMFSIEPRHKKTCLTPYANNKDANQPV